MRLIFKAKGKTLYAAQVAFDIRLHCQFCSIQNKTCPPSLEVRCRR
ncbi:protein of unknown function [Shewanella benthica]|uniref:Uncharacterized protein n=1 Tax=Shewanella benthica TaxID=43661 RepID=A0A330LY87_9GAMM|nr:protein of unknown function [Shewanella benthica]